MRIGLDARKLGPTGIGRYVNELLQAAVKLDPTIEWHLFVQPDYRQTIELSLAKNKQISFHVTEVGYYSWREQFGWARELDRYGLDLIHFPNFNIPRGLRTRAVTTIHDLTLLNYPGRRMFWGKRWLYGQVLKRSLRQAAAIITDSQDSATDIRQFAHQNGLKLGHRLQVIVLGVSDYFWAEVRQRELNAELALLNLVNPFFLVVASDFKHKNVILTLQAFAKLVAKTKSLPHKLVLVGRFGVSGVTEQWLNEHESIKNRVLIAGVVNNETLRALYHQATALVFCSLKEGFGLPILEAYAVGCPVITSNRSSMRELARGAALLVDPTNVTTITQAMSKMLPQSAFTKTKIKQQSLGKKIARSYSWSKCAKQLLKIYQHVIS
ncbi:MAG: glycosyltransferase family 1 protein [bacterium]|nr:glycosyltransferase family 1 protein [bacterium]